MLPAAGGARTGNRGSVRRCWCVLAGKQVQAERSEAAPRKPAGVQRGKAMEGSSGGGEERWSGHAGAR